MSNRTFLGKVGTTPKGEWSASVTYERLDWVTYQGSSYIALTQNTNSVPSDTNTNWMVAAKHGEFTEEQLEEFKEEVVRESKQEIDDYTDDKKDELDTYEGTKEAELNTYTGTKKDEIDTHTAQKISDYNANATSKTNTFDTNAGTKTTNFNDNATSKTNAYNQNAEDKTTAFNTNASNKQTAFDNNATQKTTDFNTNATSKTTDFNDNAEDKTQDFNDNATEKTEAFDQNAQDKTDDFDDHVAEFTERIVELEQETKDLRNASYKISGTGENVTLNKTSKNKFIKFGVNGNRKQGLPEGYTQLDYIESTGTQYISTNLSGEGNWNLKLQGTEITNNTQIIICRSSLAGYWFGITSSSVNGYYGVGSSNYVPILGTELVTVNLISKNTYIEGTVNNENIPRRNTAEQTTANYTFFADNNGSYYSKCKLYEAKFYQNNILKANLIPCKNANNEIGLYDMVNNVFYINQGTGTFIAGDIAVVPNPEYKQDIYAVGDDINLFDGTYENNYTMGSSPYKYAANNDIRSAVIKVKPNTTYAILKELSNRFRISQYTERPVVETSYATSYIQAGDSSTSYILTTSSTTYYLVIQVTNESQENVKLKVCEGSVVTSYSPYGVGTVNVVKCNENLLDLGSGTLTTNGVTVVYNKNHIKVNGTPTQNYFSILKAKENILQPGTYTLYRENTSTTARLVFTLHFEDNSTKTYYFTSGRTRYYTFTTTQRVIKIALLSDSNSTSTALNFEDRIQLVKGTTMISFVPHEEEVFNIPCQKPMPDIADYFDWDNEKEVHGFEKKILNGTEYYVTQGELTNTIEFATPNIQTGLSSTEINCFSNLFTAYSAGYLWSNDVVGITQSQSQIIIRISKTIASTVEQFKTWLSEHNIEAYCKLAEPEKLPFTQEQKAVAEQIEDSTSYYEQTNVFSNDPVSPILDITAVGDQNLVIDSIDARLSLVE